MALEFAGVGIVAYLCQIGHFYAMDPLCLFALHHQYQQTARHNKIMSKLGHLCELCQNSNYPSLFLAFCCAKVLCPECNESSHHKCKNLQSILFSANKQSSLTFCQSCNEEPSTHTCPNCNNIPLCDLCFDRIHQKAKFTFHKKRRIDKIEVARLNGGENFKSNRSRSKNSTQRSNTDSTELLNTSWKLSLAHKEYQQNLKIFSSQFDETNYKITQKWDKIAQNMRWEFVQVYDFLKQKEEELSRDIDKKKQAEIKQLTKYKIDLTESSNIQIMHEQSLSQHYFSNFLAIKYKSLKIKQIQNTVKIEDLKQDYYIGKAYFQEAIEAIKKIEMKKICLRSGSRDKKILNDIRGSYQFIPSYQASSGKSIQDTPKGAKNISKFFTQKRGIRQNIPTTESSEFSLLGSPSTKLLSKMRSQTNICLQSHKKIPKKRANIGKCLGKHN